METNRKNMTVTKTSDVQLELKTPVGNMFLVANRCVLSGVLWKKSNSPILTDVRSPEAEILLETKAQLLEYLAGKRRRFDIPFELRGTDFQKRVWNQLLKVPYGETCSYKEIAEQLNDPNASRAVGNANALNPISILVPCHRVITSCGKLGGYAGGLNTKSYLLAIERPAKSRFQAELH